MLLPLLHPVHHTSSHPCSCLHPLSPYLTAPGSSAAGSSLRFWSRAALRDPDCAAEDRLWHTSHLLLRCCGVVEQADGCLLQVALAYFSKYWPLLQNMYFSQCTVGFSGVLFAMKASHSAAAGSLPGVAHHSPACLAGRPGTLLYTEVHFAAAGCAESQQPWVVVCGRRPPAHQGVCRTLQAQQTSVCMHRTCTPSCPPCCSM